MSAGSTAVLPTAARSRWEPLRLGLVDLFHYDDQEFWFRDGRLLLRGNNGTGKSKVLALTLPFLFDGDLSAHRVEPDGDPKKRMEWNLLLDGQHEERLGYTWMEFGRVTEGGERSYLTLGCGLKAARGRGVADKWFFVTSRRVGDDLFLISPSGTVLTRDRLESALGQDGQVLRTAEQYRRLVDEHLFQLGPDRYEALVDLLIQLRQPALSKRPDEGRLSTALSQALSPVDQAVLADVAAALHDLEQQREELAALRETSAGVERFLARYTTYARVAARRQAGVLRRAQSAYEDAGRRLGAVRAEVEQRSDERDRCEELLDEGRERVVELRAAKDELAARPELKDFEAAVRLEQALGQALADAARRHGTAQEVTHDRERRHRQAAEEHDRSRAAAATTSEAAARLATDAGLRADHSEHADRLMAAATAGRSDLAALGSAVEQALTTGADRRADACEHVANLVRAADDAARAATEARRRVEDHTGALQETRDRVEAGSRAVEEQAETLVDRWSAYVESLEEIVPGHPEDHGLRLWTTTLQGPNPSASALHEAAARAGAALATAVASVEGRGGIEAQQRDGWAGERQELLDGVTPSPPPSHTRDRAARAGRPGAPLWQVVDFAADVSPAARAGFEAALEAAGVLDAWVTPNGRLLDAADEAVLVVAPPASVHLGEVLRPSLPPGQDRTLPTTAVLERLLSGIGVVPPGQGDASAAHDVSVGVDGDGGEPHSWVSADGRFRIGALRGRWHKETPAFIGHAARESARRRRLAELDDLITAAQARIDAVAAELDVLADRQRRLADELTRSPVDDDLRNAHILLSRARDDVDAATHRLAIEEEAARAAVQAHDDAARDRDETACDLGLPVAPRDLAAIQRSLAEYRVLSARLVHALVRQGDCLDDVRTWEDELATARQDEDRTRTEAAAAKARHVEAAARLATLESSLGGTVAELQARLSAVQRELEVLGPQLVAHEQAVRESVDALGQAKGRLEALTGRHEEQACAREDAAAAFQRFAGTGLLAVAVPELALPDAATSWAPDPTVRLARRVDAELDTVDDGDHAWKRVQGDITRHVATFAEALSRNGHSAFSELREERLVITVVFQGRDREPAALVPLLADEIAYRERILSAKERDLLEEHLVNDVASHLQELIAEAETQVAQMNAELEERPTSTGMRLRLRWETGPDGPDGLEQARLRLLRQDSDLWSPQDRAAVSAFLAQQIERERTTNELGTWQEHLARALDYRSWHRFVIERFQDGRWRPATGPASGGERVLTVSLPLFAAASAHYRSAHRHAPRLVLLDEAFAGVDDDSRAKCLGLLAAFDLDVVMTSEREWGFYATVPGIATHQLVRRDGVDAVHVSVWEWDGAAATPVERVLTARAPSAPRSAASAAPGAATDGNGAGPAEVSPTVVGSRVGDAAAKGHESTHQTEELF